jgi:transposase-like protein
MAVGGVFKHNTTNHHKMKQKRKRHEAAFKARVALEAMKGSKTISEIASEFGIHPGQVADWKKTLSEGLAGVFEKGAPARTEEGFEQERTELQSKIGELTIKLDFLTKKSKQLGL